MVGAFLDPLPEKMVPPGLVRWRGAECGCFPYSLAPPWLWPPSSALPLSTWGRAAEQRALRDQVSPLELRVSQVGQRIKARPGVRRRLFFPARCLTILVTGGGSLAPAWMDYTKADPDSMKLLTKLRKWFRPSSRLVHLKHGILGHRAAEIHGAELFLV